MWDGGETVTYTNWDNSGGTQQPDNFAGGYSRTDPGEQFAGINWHQGVFHSTNTLGTWNDLPNAGFDGAVQNPLLMRGIVEIDAVTTTPEPGTWALMLAGLGGMGLLAGRKRADQG